MNRFIDGLKEYYCDLRRRMIENTLKKLIENFETTPDSFIELGWAQSKEAFEQSFKADRKRMYKELEVEIEEINCLIIDPESEEFFYYYCLLLQDYIF
jgi:hypothetical protein